MEWWKKGSLDNPYDDEDFQKILDFYLFNCPVSIDGKKVSKRAKSFEEYKITDQKLKSLLRLMKHGLTDVNNNYRCIEANGDVEKSRIELEKNSNLKDEYYEFIIFKEDSNKGKTRTIYYAIRNAFAHGSFSIKNVGSDRVYYFESSKNGKIKSQIRLKERTLLNWIDLLDEVIKIKKETKKKRSTKRRAKVRK